MTPILLLGFTEATFTPEEWARIEAAAPDMRIVRTRERAEIETILDEIVIAAGGLPHDLIPQATNLRWLQQWGAGADWLLRHPEVAELDFVLTNASGIHAIPISEHIFAMLLAFGRRLPDALRAQDEGVWIGNYWQRVHGTSIQPGQKYLATIDKQDVFELAGKTMLIAGVGAIGERTALVAQAFGMHVVGVRRNPQDDVPGVDELVAPDQLLATLPAADVVINALPLTGETQHLFGAAAFAAMRPDAVYINIGRGGTTDEVALVAALEAGAIAWAGLDVFETEPLPTDSPLWKMPNVIITSHYSGLTPEYDRRALEIFLDNLDRYRRGQPLRNVVDKRLGY